MSKMLLAKPDCDVWSHGPAEHLQVWCVIQGWHPRLLVATEHEASEAAPNIVERSIPQGRY